MARRTKAAAKAAAEGSEAQATSPSPPVAPPPAAVPVATDEPIDGVSALDRLKKVESLFGKIPDDKIAAMAKVRPEAVVRYRENMVRAQAALAPAPKVVKPRDTGPPPDCVKVCERRLVIVVPGYGRKMVRREDIFSGPIAAFLWEHHQECVERYPPAT